MVTRFEGEDKLGIYGRGDPLCEGQKALDIRFEVVLCQEVVEKPLLGVDVLASLVQLRVARQAGTCGLDEKEAGFFKDLADCCER